jgi:hypothetical protein
VKRIIISAHFHIFSSGNRQQVVGERQQIVGNRQQIVGSAGLLAPIWPIGNVADLQPHMKRPAGWAGLVLVDG